MKKRCLLFFLLALAPLCISSIFLMLESQAQSLLTVMPEWNDEDFYFNQIKSMLTYGHPLGYYGYDGSHAMVGNFGAHGFICMVPYAIFCKIFGLHLNSITLLNNIFLCIDILLYEFLFKPSIKKILLFITLISSPMVIFYTNISMMEAEHYFFAITIALEMVYMIENKDNKKTKALLIFSVIYAVLCRITWSVLFFPMILILLKNTKAVSKIAKCILAGIGSIIGCIVCYLISRVFTAPYFSGIYIIDEYIDLLKTGITFSKVRGLIEETYDGVVSALGHFDVMWVNVSRDYIIVVIILTLLFWILNRKKELAYIPAVVLLGFFIGIFALYYGEVIAIRHIYPAALFAIVYMFASLNSGKMRYAIYAVSSIMFICTFVLQINHEYAGRNCWNTEERQEFYSDIQSHMDVIQISENEETPWDNTLGISLKNSIDRIYELFVPAGTGINYYMDFPEKNGEMPRYFMISNNEEDIKALINLGYKKIDEFEDILIFEK